MACYAIGDIQGCLGCLHRLLETVAFDAARDQLWLCGDLVNRGPDSLGALRFAKDIGAEVVLGNHDLHLLAVSVGARPLKSRDTFGDILKAPDREALLDWLIQRPLMLRDKHWAMVHAGLVPQWDIDTAWDLAQGAHARIVEHRGDVRFFSSLYGDQPELWSNDLEEPERTRFIVNVFTRLRYCDPEGRLRLSETGPPGSQAAPYRPWFEIWPHGGQRVLFGHWSTLGARVWGRVVSLDSGCVWGGSLTALRLDSKPIQFFNVECEASQSPG